MTKQQFNKIMDEVRRAQADGPFDDDAAYDIAEFILLDNPGLKEYIQRVVGARDAKGWLADEI